MLIVGDAQDGGHNVEVNGGQLVSNEEVLATVGVQSLLKLGKSLGESSADESKEKFLLLGFVLLLSHLQ